MTVGTDGLLHGTCEEWDQNNTSGVIFQYNPRKKQNGFNIIHTYAPFGAQGTEEPSALTLGPDGNFYGTTENDPLNPYGTVFKVTPAGVYTTLHAFQGQSQNDGAYPSIGYSGGGVPMPIPLILGFDGNFYGTTDEGRINGEQNGGTVYQITLSGAVTILCYFPDGYLRSCRCDRTERQFLRPDCPRRSQQCRFHLRAYAERRAHTAT